MCSARKLLNPASALPGGNNALVNPASLVTNSSNRLVNPAGSLLAPKKKEAAPAAPASEASILNQAPTGATLLGG